MNKREELKTIILDHGTGAKLSHELVALIAETLGDTYIGDMQDSAVLPLDTGKIAVTTDSFVVTPIFFSNGDIGKISVCGTVNDLAVSGATPLYLTLALILEVGFPMRDLIRIIESIRNTAIEAKIKIVGGDTKVLNKGEIDKICINTTGIGVFKKPPLDYKKIKRGDKIILSGHIGNHSINLLSIREGLGFEHRIKSDCAPLNSLISDLLNSIPIGGVKAIRDVTRGGLCSVLHEYSNAVNLAFEFFENKLPITQEVIMASDMLGINPIHLANEGCICLFVDPEHECDVLNVIKNNKYGKAATTIGHVLDSNSKGIIMVQKNGVRTVLEELVGAELPRLC